MASIEGGGTQGPNSVGTAGGEGSGDLSAEQMAANLIDASTGPAGLEVDRLAAMVDLAMDRMPAMSALPGMSGGPSASELQAAVLDQLNARQAAQFEAAIEPYRASPFTTPAQEIALDAPFERSYLDPYNPIGVNAEGQAINANGEVIAELPGEYFFESTDTPEYRMAAQQREMEQNALRNIELITNGPFEGLFAAGGVIYGADQRMIEGLASGGRILDGLTYPLGPSPEHAMSTPAQMGIGR